MVRRKVILPSWNVSEEVSTDVNALKERFTDFSTGEIVINTTPENVTLSTLDSNGNLSTFIGETKVSEMISNALDASNYATEEFVKESIANAELGGEGGEVDLSEYAKKTDIEGFVTEEWIGKQGFITEHQDITGKQDVIDDLEAIREGAAKGATALQEVPDGYATEAWVGEQGFLTEHQDITGKQNVIDDLEAIREGAAKGATALQEVPDGYATEAWVGEQGFLTEHQDITGKQDVIEDLEAIREGAAKGVTALQSVPEEYVTETELDAKGYLTEHQDISHLTTKDEFLKIFDEGDSDKTIRRIANEELASQLILSSATESLDTLEEIAAWIQEHPEDAASMNAKILNLEISAHTHENKEVLDGITSDDISKWNEPHEYLPLSGGVLNGVLNTTPECNIVPTTDGEGTIGQDSYKYSNVYSYDVTSNEIHTNKLSITAKPENSTNIVEVNDIDGLGYMLKYSDNTLSLYSTYGGELFSVLQDGTIIGKDNNAIKVLVSSASTVPFKGLPVGDTDVTVAIGNHTHEAYVTNEQFNSFKINVGEIDDKVNALETEHNTLVLDKDKIFNVLTEEFDFGPIMSLNDVRPYFILRNESGTYYSIDNLNTWGASFGIEEGSFGIFSTIIKCKPIEVENKDGNDIILLSVVSAITKYIDSSGVTQEKPFGVLGIKNRTVTINGATINVNCIVQKNSTFKITVPIGVTNSMEDFRKETITIGTESNLDFFTPEKIWKEVVDNRGIVSVFEFRTPYFRTGSYSDTNLFTAKYNLKLDSLPNTNVSNKYGVVIDKIKYHHDLILPESPKIGKKIEIINNSLYGHKILAEGKNITYSFNNSLQMVSGDNGIENTNKMVTCISDGEDWYIYKNM